VVGPPQAGVDAPVVPDPEPAAHYDRVTAAWRLLLGEELHYGVFPTGEESLEVATAELTGRMIAALDLRPGDAVLDVGCGTGTQACRIAARYGVHVVGISTSAVGVDAARARAADAGVSEVATFRVADGTDNRLPDESFHRVWVLESSHLMRERDTLVTECARVLRPGGRLALCDIVRRRDIPFLEVRARRDEFATLRAAFGTARMDPLTEYRRLAEESGLVVDRCDDLTTTTLPTFDRWRRNAAEHAAELTGLLGAAGLDEFVRAADILEAFWRDGTLGYGLLAARKP
jgi:27-O-demethylrifamycin SV methyltransferase